MSQHADRDDDLFANPVVVVPLLIGIFIIVIWSFFKVPIASFGMQLADLFACGLRWLYSLGDVGSVIAYIIAPFQNVETLSQIRQETHYGDPRYIKWAQVVPYYSFIAEVLRLPVGILAVIASIAIWKRQEPMRAKTRFSIFTLLRESARYYPHLLPALQTDLLKKDHLHGPLASAKHPIRFAIENKLILVHDLNFKQERTDKLLKPTFDKSAKRKDGYLVLKEHLSKSIRKIHNRCVFLEEETQKVLVEQLGPKYRGVKHLSKPRRAMYAVCITFMQEGKEHQEEAMALLRKLNRSFDKNKISTDDYIDMEGVDKAIEKYANTEIVRETEKRYAYELTVLPGLLEEARSKGKIWSCLWFWVKYVDRTLWYTLHQEGGQCGWVEALAPRAHKLAEQMNGFRLETPFVDTAVIGLHEFLDETEGWIVAKEVDDDRLLDEEDEDDE